MQAIVSLTASFILFLVSRMYKAISKDLFVDAKEAIGKIESELSAETGASYYQISFKNDKGENVTGTSANYRKVNYKIGDTLDIKYIELKSGNYRVRIKGLETSGENTPPKYNKFFSILSAAFLVLAIVFMLF